jgi:anti-anti-sigma factor
VSARSPQPLAWIVHADVHAVTDIVTLVVSGRLGSIGAPTFRALVATAATGHQHVQIDLTAVDYISSAGIGVLREAAERQRSAGGTLTIVRASEPVALTLRLAGAIAHLQIAPDTVV